MTKELRRALRSGALQALTQLAGIAPRTWIRSSLTLLARAANRGARARLTAQNLELAFGSELEQPALRELQARVFRHAARQLSEWLELATSRAPGTTSGERCAWIAERVQLDPSLEILQRAQAAGRGVIVLTAHLGNWEFLAARLVNLGFSGAVVGLRRPKDASRAWLERMRKAYGAKTLAQDSPPRVLLEVLRQGGILGLLCDLEVRRLDGEFVPFFGRPALSMTAPAALARASGAALVPVRCTSIDDRRYLLRVEPPLQCAPALPRLEQRLDLLQQINQTYERWIREAPAEWAWHQDRWRTRPGDYEAVPLCERKRRVRAKRDAPKG